MKDKFIPIFSIILFIGIVVVAILVTSKKEKSVPSPSPTLSVNIEGQKEGNKVEDLQIEDMTIGKGIEAVTGKKVTVNYLGTLTNGTKFDSSYDRNEPFSFNLGAGEVIQGWDQGVVGMRVGGRRKLTIPSNLAYGDRGAGALIPPGATLIFEVELLGVE